MKKIILIAFAIAGFIPAISQNDTNQYQIKDGVQVRRNDSIKYPVTQDPLDKNNQIDLSKTCVTMSNGKLMVVKNGMLVPLEDAMVMQNGTIIMTNGMIKTKEGKVTQINEGDCLDMNGEMVPLLNNKMLNDGPPK